MLISLVIAAAKVVQIERITKEKALKTTAEAIFSIFNVQCSMIFSYLCTLYDSMYRRETQCGKGYR